MHIRIRESRPNRWLIQVWVHDEDEGEWATLSTVKGDRSRAHAYATGLALFQTPWAEARVFAPEQNPRNPRPVEVLRKRV